MEDLHWLPQVDHELELVLFEFLELHLRDVVERDVQLVHPIRDPVIYEYGELSNIYQGGKS